METERYYCSECGIEIFSSTRQVCGKYFCENEKKYYCSVCGVEVFSSTKQVCGKYFCENEKSK